MRTGMKNSLKIGMIYAGTVLGAGFASGQEILTFFARYGRHGMLGVAIAGFLFIATAAVILLKTFVHRYNGYDAFLHATLPRVLVRPVSIIITLFLGVTYIAMISGSGALMKERFSLPPFLGILITSAVCFVVFVGNLKGVSIINSILTPIMTAGMALVSVCLLATGVPVMSVLGQNPGGGYVLSAFVYVGFNLLTASVMLVSLRSLLTSRATCIAGACVGGGLLALCAGLVYLAICKFTDTVSFGQLPMLTLAARLGPYAYNLYGVVLYAAMITTAVSVGFGLLQKIRVTGLSHLHVCAIVCLAAIPVSFIPFSTVVNTFYTLFGYLGLTLLFFLFLCLVRPEK